MPTTTSSSRSHRASSSRVCVRCCVARAPRVVSRTSRSATSSSTSRRARSACAASRLELRRREFDLLAFLCCLAPAGVHARAAAASRVGLRARVAGGRHGERARAPPARPRSRSTRRIRATSSPCVASATASSPDGSEDGSGGAVEARCAPRRGARRGGAAWPRAGRRAATVNPRARSRTRTARGSSATGR